MFSQGFHNEFGPVALALVHHSIERTLVGDRFES
jgi:hypothetical protein